jgi:hypothetical protein
VIRKEIDDSLAGLTIIVFYDGILLQWSMNRDKIEGEAYVNTFKKNHAQGLDGIAEGEGMDFELTNAFGRKGVCWKFLGIAREYDHREEFPRDL